MRDTINNRRALDLLEAMKAQQAKKALEREIDAQAERESEALCKAGQFRLRTFRMVDASGNRVAKV